MSTNPQVISRPLSTKGLMHAFKYLSNPVINQVDRKRFPLIADDRNQTCSNDCSDPRFSVLSDMEIKWLLLEPSWSSGQRKLMSKSRTRIKMKFVYFDIFWWAEVICEIEWKKFQLTYYDRFNLDFVWNFYWKCQKGFYDTETMRRLEDFECSNTL